MSIKTILVPVTDDPVERSAIVSAFLVGRTFGAHVVGLYSPTQPDKVTAENIAMSRTLVTNQDVLQMLDDSEREESTETKKARETFKEIAEENRIEWTDKPHISEGPSATFKVATIEGPEGIATYGRIFDLIVLCQPKRDPGHLIRKALRAALFSSGRPVLMVPKETPATIGSKVLIAWNGSALSARAAAISRQYFYHAQQVGILSVNTGRRQGPPARELAEYIAWHGIEATVRETRPGHRSLGKTFLEEAADFKADLFVMGAYAKSPFRESLTRGVTNYILGHADIPVLMTR